MSIMIPVLLLVLASNGPGQILEYVAISESTSESSWSFSGWRMDKPLLSVAEIPLELGDSVEGQILSVGVSGQRRSDLRVEIRYETSITIMNEGPHLDLVNWKHYTSEWLTTTRISEDSFKLPVFTDQQTSMFPDVTAEEIQQAVLAEGGERWAALVRDIRGPRDNPAAVGLSSIWIRVQVLEEGAWKTLMTLVTHPAMGC